MLSRRAIEASVVALLLLAANVARAQQSEAESVAASHDLRASQLFEDGQYARALVELQAAQELLPATARVYNIATCHERLGDLTQAIVYYQRFIEAPDAPDDRRQVARERIDQLRGQLASEQEAPTGEASESQDAPQGEPTPETPSRRGLSPAVFYALLGVTAAAGIGLAVTGGIALYYQNEFENTVYLSDEGKEDRREGRPYATAGDVLVGVTAAGALATLIVGLLTRWRSDDETSRGPDLTFGGGSLSLSGTF